MMKNKVKYTITNEQPDDTDWSDVIRHILLSNCNDPNDGELTVERESKPDEVDPNKEYLFFREKDIYSMPETGGIGEKVNSESYYRCAGIITWDRRDDPSTKGSGKELTGVSMNPFTGQYDEDWYAEDEIHIFKVQDCDYEWKMNWEHVKWASERINWDLYV